MTSKPCFRGSCERTFELAFSACWLAFYLSQKTYSKFRSKFTIRLPSKFKDKSAKFVILSGVRKHKAKNPHFDFMDTSLTLSMTSNLVVSRYDKFVKMTKQTLLLWLAFWACACFCHCETAAKPPSLLAAKGVCACCNAFRQTRLCKQIFNMMKL